MQMHRARWGALAVLAASTFAFAAKFGWDWDRAPRNAAHASASAQVMSAPANSKPVNGSQPLVPGDPFTLVGEIADLPASVGPISVIARVGDHVFPAQVEGRDFQVVVADGGGTALVRVEVSAGNTYYEAWLGSAPMLRTLAGSDKRLVTSEHALLRVSAYSTSLSVLGRFALGGRAPLTDVEIERAMRAVTTDDLEGAVYLLRGMADGAIALPSGYTTGYQAIGNRDVFRTYMQNASYRQASAGLLGQQAAPVPLQSLQELPEHTVFTGPLPAHLLPIGTNDVLFLQRQSANQSLMYEHAGLLDPVYTLSLTADGALELLPNTELVDVQVDAGSGASVQRQRVKFQFKRLYKGSTFSHWAVMAQTQERTLPDGQPHTVIRHSIMTSVDLARWTLPQGWPDRGAWMLRTGCVERLTGSIGLCMLAEHRFNFAGDTEIRGQHFKFSSTLSPLAEQGRIAFEWSLDPDRRAMHVLHRFWQVEWTYWRVDGHVHEAGPVLYMVRDVGGDQRVSIGLDFTVPRRGDPEMSSNNGTWRWADYRADAHSYQGVDDTFDVQQDVGGIAMHRDSRVAGGAWRPLHSIVFGGSWYQVETQPPLMTCLDTPIYPCASQTTYFRPSMRVGNRYYGVRERMEHIYTGDGTGEGTRRLIDSVGTIVECTGGECLLATGMQDRDKFTVPVAPAAIPMAARTPLSARPAIRKRVAAHRRGL